MIKGPKHIGLILDGNRRWAEKNNVSVREGHRAGAVNLERLVQAAVKRGVKILTIYALSTENLAKRSKGELVSLFELLRYFMINKRKKLDKEGAQLNILGDISVFPARVKKSIEDTVSTLKGNKKIVINMALNYGGRQEIIRAMRKIAAKKIKPEHITERVIESNLDTAGQPDPDLIIRTGGKVRLSNFLLWQGSYSELYFTDTLWPDFSAAELDRAIRSLEREQRNYGV